MKSNRRKPDNQTLGKAEIEALFNTDKCEVDILSPPPDNPCIKKGQPKSEFEELFAYAGCIYDMLSKATDKIDNLRSLFGVRKEGDGLECSYKIMFNQEKEETDDLGAQYLNKFLDDYSLNIRNIERELRMLKNLIEAKTLRGKPNYCEVDLFNKEKEPVEC